MTLTLADEHALIAQFAVLADEANLYPALPSTRRPTVRFPRPVHVPSVEAERRRALPFDAATCPTCNERVAEIVSGGTCPNCQVRWMA